MKTALLVFSMALSTVLIAGDLNPPAAPSAGGTMKPLDEVEPRIAIHQADIPFNIKASGSYYLAEKISYSGTDSCIEVSANNVTIDLSGFTITGTYTSPYGIYMDGRENVEIRNGTIYRFIRGIVEDSTNGQNHRVIGVKVMHCEMQGIFMQNCENCQVRDCTVANSCWSVGSTGSTYAIIIGDSGIVSGNTVYKNGNGSSMRPYGISTGSNCRIMDNTVHTNGANTIADYAIGIWTNNCSTVTGNCVYNNGYSADCDYIYALHAGNGCVVNNNTVYDNGYESVGVVYGIWAGSGCSINNNAAYSNGGSSTGSHVYGIFALNGSRLNGNTSYNNGNSAGSAVCGIYANPGCTINGNSAYDNGLSATGTSVYGIYTNTGVVLTGNTAMNNGTSSTGAVCGIYVGGYSLVNNNSAYNNAGTGGGTNMNTPTSCTFGTNCAP